MFLMCSFLPACISFPLWISLPDGNEVPLTVTGLEDIDCMVKDELEIYLAAKPTPKSDVLATYEIEYSTQFRGDKYSAKRILHIGTRI